MIPPSHTPSASTIAILCVLLCLFLSSGACKKSPPPVLTPADLQITGEGFLVWERLTDSGWELWTMNLDGSNERRLVEPDPGRDYFCPHISPDGRSLAFMSYPRGTDTYEEGSAGQLHLLDLAANTDRILVPAARSYREGRAAVWIDNENLIYISNDGFTEQINIATGDVTRLTRKPAKEFGWLIDPTLAWATTGKPEFAPYLQPDLAVLPKNSHGGCQPYFSRDGSWGYWVGGSGGPFARIHLATGEISSILERDDPRMPPQQNYAYFPMLSSNQHLITFAASNDEHDHFKANYDIFVARIDPETLDIIDRPARFTNYEGTDRFPDVFLAPLPLGRYAGEAPLNLTFEPPDNKPGWAWSINDQPVEAIDVLTHSFNEPGDYRITATRQVDDQYTETKAGHVHVRAAVPPAVTSVRLISPEEIIVLFDEGINTDNAKVSLASGIAAASLEPRPDQRSLRITLAKPLTNPDQLTLEQITDRAPFPNIIPVTKIPITPGLWPTDKTGLVFLWKNNSREARNELPDGSTSIVKPVGQALYNHRYAMLTDGGHFIAPEAGPRISAAAKKADTISIEATLTPLSRPDDGFKPIITLSSGSDTRNVSIGQVGGTLMLRLRTPENGLNGDKQERQLSRLKIGRPHHLSFSYSNGHIAVFIDGEQVWARPRIQGDFSNWVPMELTFGAEHKGSSPWHGIIENIAIYDRIIDPPEARQNADALTLIRGRTPDPETWNVEVELEKTTPLPTLEEIKPYTEALVAHQYKILSKPPDSPLAETILITHWAILDSKTMPIADARPGDTLQLQIQRFDQNPQLNSLRQKNNFADQIDLTEYFDTTPLTP
ncbi:MAG: LamG-like jellyroll fold domain-containing protein [Verrucomicrobiota bacterium]